MTFDFLVAIFWIGATTRMATYAKCPSSLVGILLFFAQLFRLKFTTVTTGLLNGYCPGMIWTISMGYLCFILFGLKLYDGMMAKKESEIGMAGNHFMFARGNWKK
jgi:hypothetical protein